MVITIVTLFPEMFESPFEYSILKRAIDRKIISIKYINIRDFGLGKHKTVDDTPYGGGNGMILRVDVLKSAIDKSRDRKLKKNEEQVILLSPHGKKFNQEIAFKFSKLKHLILVCGHYEGFDDRIRKFIDIEISVGDYVLTGGEIPAMIIADSVARLVKNVIREGSSEKESFSPNLEYPQYTKPQIFEKMSVPNVLLSGNHKDILEWRRKQSVEITQKLRPDLLKDLKG